MAETIGLAALFAVVGAGVICMCICSAILLVRVGMDCVCGWADEDDTP